MDEFDDFEEDVVFSSIHLHLIFSTKNQQPLITGEIREELWDLIREIILDKQTAVHGIGGTADHVHLLVSPSVDVSIDEIIQTVKKDTVAWVHEIFPKMKNFAWQDGYAGFTVGVTEIAKATAYIERQAQHHEVISFQDEYRALLMENGIEFDEKDLFD